MTLDPALAIRLAFLCRVVGKECSHLLATDARLFAQPFTLDRAEALAHDQDLAERVEAFVGRFARLQDTIGDKLLPLLLQSLGERTGAAIDNLDRAERLGLIASAEDWMVLRRLRNQMVHEYVEDPAVLVGALQAGHCGVSLLAGAAQAMIAESGRRGWMDRETRTP